ncbi:MAG: hypothetical protein JW800_07990 [Candidatus Omnitrophica bacterium]|nr:hypothetical protein [Candidatus Omnitrophota bacterium]
MLKRYQILLEDWMAEHLKGIGDKYDISLSEAVRILLALQVPRMISIAYPKIKSVVFDEDLVKIIKKANTNKSSMEAFHKVLSKIYFESHKSIEAWFEEEKKRIKNDDNT